MTAAGDDDRDMPGAGAGRGSAPAKVPARDQAAGRGGGARARKPKPEVKKLRVSLVFEPEAGPILDWMMRLSSAPTKADLFRKALDHYEQFLVEREERRTRHGARRPD